MQKVSLSKCSTYQESELLSSIKKSLDLIGGLPSFVKPGQKVLLKVNMLGAHHPDKAVTTHPEFLRAVIKLVKEVGGTPFVGDSPGFDNAKKSAEVSGYLKVCSEERVPFVYFNESAEVKNPNGKRFKSFQIAKAVLDADVIINLPKFKTHGLTGITCAVKNMFGCVPGLLKSEYHVKVPTRKEFNIMLLDLLEVVKPALNIVDAVVGMEGENGPHAGDPKFIGLIAVSADAEVVDQALYDAVADTDFKLVKLLPEIVVPGPSFVRKIVRSFLLEKPVVKKKKCTSCKICGKVCKSQAISYPSKYPKFDYNKCIRCFCCAEMCPEHAIFVSRSRFTRFLFSTISRLQELRASLSGRNEK